MSQKTTTSTKEEIKQGYVLKFCKENSIRQDVEDMLLELILEPKWIGRTEKQIERVIIRLSGFNADFQKVLIQTTLDNNYQGLIFSDSKEKEQRFLKTYGTSKVQRLERLINNGGLEIG